MSLSISTFILSLSTMPTIFTASAGIVTM